MTDKERLERIIQMQYDGYTIWDMGENDLVWLIKQAERVQELEKQNKRYRVAIEFGIEYLKNSDIRQVQLVVTALKSALEESK